jgi:hypothetical protein
VSDAAPGSHDHVAVSAPHDSGASVRMERVNPVATIVVDLPQWRWSVPLIDGRAGRDDPFAAESRRR